jgi:hypothetical protein
MNLLLYGSGAVRNPTGTAGFTKPLIVLFGKLIASVIEKNRYRSFEAISRREY